MPMWGINGRVRAYLARLKLDSSAIAEEASGRASTTSSVQLRLRHSFWDELIPAS